MKYGGEFHGKIMKKICQKMSHGGREGWRKREGEGERRMSEGEQIVT